MVAIDGNFEFWMCQPVSESCFEKGEVDFQWLPVLPQLN